MRKENLICRRILLITVACMFLIFSISAVKIHNRNKKDNITFAYAENVEVTQAAVSTQYITVEPTVEPTAVPTENPTEKPLKSLGVYKLTAYCSCSYCCGKSDGITASGTQAVEGRTIAADTNLLPFGTKVVINGHEFEVEDCGGCVNGNHIDVFMESHDAAVVFGVQYAEVFVHE